MGPTTGTRPSKDFTPSKRDMVQVKEFTGARQSESIEKVNKFLETKHRCEIISISTVFNHKSQQMVYTVVYEIRK